MSRRPDAVVVGAGIVGAAVAWQLSRDGLAVAVVDAGIAGGGATAGGMGHVVVMDDSPAQLALTHYSRALLHDIAEELPPACELERNGTLWIAEDEAQLDAARAKRAYYEDHDVACELLDAHQLAAAEPELRAGLAGALRVTGDMVVYPPALGRWFLDRAADLGATVSIRTHIDTLGSIDAPVVVNATGAAAAQLTPGLRIEPRKGHLVITERYAPFCRHQLVELGYLHSAHCSPGESGVSAASVAFNLQPRRTGQLLIGSSRELVGWDARVNRGIVARMLARAAHFTPRVAALRAVRTWTAFRPATPDNLPCIGRAPDQDGVWVAAGHEGLGITTALGTAAVLSDLIAGRAPHIDAQPYDPARMMAAA